MIRIEAATDQREWDDFLSRQTFRPFLQSWTMGAVEADTGEKPIRIVARDERGILGLAHCNLVPARRGRHLAVPYGPLGSAAALPMLLEKLKEIAKQERCSFIRMSPFLPASEGFEPAGSLPAPLHLLAEHIWYLPLVTPDPWASSPAPLSPPSPDG
ncbi:MAG TPA: hypothetical protein VI873_01830, partial [Candidatus Peribacteraceae bacterium]|nr:hypothetical protein [Candidatus Peribacteraceae bacterium]